MMSGKFHPSSHERGQGICLSGLTQIQFYLTSWSLNACELCDPLILNRCSVCLCDFTNTFGWLPVINRNGFQEVGAPLRHSRISWDRVAFLTLPAVCTVGSQCFLCLGPALVLHACKWLCLASVTGATCRRSCRGHRLPAGRRREGLIPTLLSAFTAPRLHRPWPVGTH